MLINRWFPALVALWLGVVSGFPAGAEFPFIVDKWASGPGDQKLPESAVIALTQTRDGYLWLGTLNGLVRFDGTRFTVFNNANTPGLEGNRIVHLFQDSRTNLWVGTDPGGVVLIQPDGTFQKIDAGRGGSEKRLVSACEDSTGAVWLYAADGQLTRFQNGTLEKWSMGSDQLASAKTLVAEGGLVWIGNMAGSVAVNAAGQFVSQALPLQTVVQAVNRQDFLAPSRDGGHWRLADGRIEKWRGTVKERDVATYKWNPNGVLVTAVCEDAQGNLIVGTQGEGVFWYDASGQALQISTAQGLSQNARGYVLSLCLDREGNLWIGTDGGGLNRVKRKIFGVLDESRDWTIQSVAEDQRGGLWFGTVGKGLKCLRDGKVEQLGASQGLTSLLVRSVLVDQSQNVFFGAVGWGLQKVVNGQFVQYTNPENANPVVTAMHEDRAGNLWFGTQGGLVCKDKSGWKRYTTHDGLSVDVVRALADDAEGSLWIGTEGGGLNRLRDGKFTAFRKADGLAGETITSLWCDRDNVLWIATEGMGLCRFKAGRWTTFATTNGLPTGSIGYLIEDAQNNLWMGTYAGLMRVSKKALNDFADHTTDIIPCRVFGESDGMLTSECTQGSQPAACLAKDGRLWFPTTKGLVWMNPLDLKPNTNRPPVIIESVLLEGEQQITNAFGARPATIVIPPGKERLEIRYTSLNFSAPENVRFKYRMEGHESRWFEAGSRRDAEYLKLPPGDYVFRVIAYNEDGVVSLDGASLGVRVLPPFWRTGWFITVMTVGVLGMVAGIVYYFSTQKLQRELAVLKQREELERERARIARDLHDQLGANLTQVSLLGEMAQADKTLPDEVESHAQQICQTALETTRALDEIVWAVNPSNDTLESLVNYACKYAQEYLELAGIRHRFEVPAQLPAVDIAPEVRHNVFLAFKESVNNVVKHAQASAVSIRLRLDAGKFTLEIEDDGRGIDNAPKKTGRSGMGNLRKRMEDVGGSFAIGPAPAKKGTLVQLTAPLAHR